MPKTNETETERLAREAKEMEDNLAALRAMMAQKKDSGVRTERGTRWRAGASLRPHVPNRYSETVAESATEASTSLPQQQQREQSFNKENIDQGRTVGGGKYEVLDGSEPVRRRHWTEIAGNDRTGDHGGASSSAKIAEDESLLMGDYDETASAAAFQAALAEWRSAKSASSQPLRVAASAAGAAGTRNETSISVIPKNLRTETPVIKSSEAGVGTSDSGFERTANFARFARYVPGVQSVGSQERGPLFFEEIRRRIRVARALAALE
eukprot:ANDGO_04346.mRNA.1 hypothetical protein